MGHLGLISRATGLDSQYHRFPRGAVPFPGGRWSLWAREKERENKFKIRDY